MPEKSGKMPNAGGCSWNALTCLAILFAVFMTRVWEKSMDRSPGKALRALMAFLALSAAAVSACAHHSVWAEFDNQNLVEIRGRFTQMDWTNPHSWVHFEVSMDDGTTVTWAAETPPPNQLIRQGWRRSDLQAGDEILVSGYVARNGTKRLWARNVAIVAQNGEALSEPRTVLALFEPKPEGVPDGLLPGQNR